MKLSSIVVGTGAFLVAVCATASGRVSIVSEDQATAAWTLATDAPRVVAGYPDSAADKSQDVCINIGYLIGQDGKTSNFTQMKAWSSASQAREPEQSAMQPFVQSSAAAVSMWRFVPAGGKARSIYTSASFAFAGGKGAAVDEIRGHCRIADLADFVARAQARQAQRGDLARSRTERMRIEHEQGERMGTNY